MFSWLSEPADPDELLDFDEHDPDDDDEVRNDNVALSTLASLGLVVEEEEVLLR